MSEKLTLKDAAERAGYNYNSVYRRYKEGLIPVEQVGRVLISDVETVRTAMKAYEAGARRQRKKAGDKEQTEE